MNTKCFKICSKGRRIFNWQNLRTQKRFHDQSKLPLVIHNLDHFFKAITETTLIHTIFLFYFIEIFLFVCSSAVWLGEAELGETHGPLHIVGIL